VWFVNVHAEEPLFVPLISEGCPIMNTTFERTTEHLLTSFKTYQDIHSGDIIPTRHMLSVLTKTTDPADGRESYDVNVVHTVDVSPCILH